MTGNNMKGFTLFYALLVASLALSIGAAIFDITIREIDLSSAATQSQYAVYIADTGSECALYWDSKYANAANGNNGGSNSAFATSSSDVLVPTASSGLLCNTVDITSPAASFSSVTAASSATTTFTISGVSFHGQTPCATVQIAKAGTPSITTIISQGFNTCTPGVLQLERVLQVSY
jgi:hypothetical protein